MSAGQHGGRMLHIGCECWDGASVSLTQLSNASVQCSPSFHPSIPPPPLSSSNKWSFCASVFAAVGWRATAGPSPKTSGLSWNSFLSQSIICGLSILPSWFFSHLFFPSLLLPLHLCCSIWLLVLTLIHPSQSLSSSDISAEGFLKFLPSPFVHDTYCCSAVFHQKPLLSSRLSSSSLFTLCFAPSFKRLQRHLKIDFSAALRHFPFRCRADSNQRKRQTQKWKEKHRDGTWWPIYTLL